ncbi:hypothetical protein TELCIR_05913 [Teladorsagia circumcincta]|uniref:Uncharacterized protein n=1 Tax=Teladorsagia circumcincta TaxID=45464 RepID=A0A2G9UPM3_TELCI|nr:hypothetical protein TELCIR_05913 [Teladorsagia circumcincta]
MYSTLLFVMLSTIFGDLHVRPDCEMDMDVNCNQYPKNHPGKSEHVKEEAHICSDTATNAEYSEIAAKLEQREDNMVQVFPQAVPIYEHRQPVNHFSYCDRSVFSRHLFF